MVNSKMSDLGDTISHDSNDALEACLGDGAVKAGMLSGILPATGKAVAVDGDSATAGISFVGIADRHPTIDIDTVITDALPMELIKPKSGKTYSAFIEDPGADIPKGTPLTFGQTTAGSLKKVTTKAATGNLTPTIPLTGNAQDIIVEPILAYTAKKVLNGATACLIEWK
jgi:hypothetical protein